MRRRLALVPIVLAAALSCSPGAEPPRAQTSREPGAAQAATRSPSAAPLLSADAVLAPDGGTSPPPPGVLVDPETGEALPPALAAVLETGPGGPVLPGTLDLLFEEPAHRGRIPIVLSGTSVIDIAPMETGDAAARLRREAPAPTATALPVPAAPAATLR